MNTYTRAQNEQAHRELSTEDIFDPRRDRISHILATMLVYQQKSIDKNALAEDDIALLDSLLASPGSAP